VPIDDRTSTQNYPKPNIANTLADDVGRLRTALDDIDEDMAAKATSTHVHGNITNAGAIGSTTNLPIITTTSGVLTTGSFGTAANTFCQGNDARLSDTRTPTDGSVTTAKIGDDAVTYAKIQNVSATDRLLGRSTAGAGDVEEITCTAAGRNLLDDADATAQRTTLGLGTLATQSGTFSGTSSGTNTGDQTITLTGDVTGTGTGSFTTAIASGVIVDADVNASAAIAGTKISPDFGSQNVVTTGNLQGASINGGPLAGFRNAIINGNFDIWQRGTSSTSTTSGIIPTADRWRAVTASGSGRAVTYSQQLFANGQTDVPGNPKYFFRWDETTAGSSYTIKRLAQRIESVATFSGEQVTLSFYAKASSTITLPSLVIAQDFGSGGSPSAAALTTVTSNVSVGTSWVHYSYTITVPSISGKTLGTDGNDCLEIRINLPFSGTFTFDIAQVQIEPGPVATTFERRPIATELALCQRYYEISHLLMTSFSGNVTSGQDYDGMAGYKVTKRIEPSITLTQFGSANFPSTVGTITVTGLGGFRERRTANGTGMGRFFSTWTSDAEL
jgi:hypothetical protein